MAKKIMFTSTELTTDGTITLELGGRTNNDFTKMTLQVVDGAVSPTAGNITINAKVDKENAAATFQLIGTFNLASKAPVVIDGAYEELEFIGDTMTATSSAFIVVAAS